jgi:hypothetical protein
MRIKDLTFKRGDRFLIGGVSYILAQSNDDKCCLISLENGNRWDNSIDIVDSIRITYDDMEKLTNKSGVHLDEIILSNQTYKEKVFTPTKNSVNIDISDICFSID